MNSRDKLSQHPYHNPNMQYASSKRRKTNTCWKGTQLYMYVELKMKASLK